MLGLQRPRDRGGSAALAPVPSVLLSLLLPDAQDGFAGGGSQWSMTAVVSSGPAGPSMAECRIEAQTLAPEHREAIRRAAAALPADLRVTALPAERLATWDFEVRVRSGGSIAIKRFDEARIFEAPR